VNIPIISLTEWHPFSISSVDYPRISLVIKTNKVNAMKGVTFTEKLKLIVALKERFDVNIDGP